MKNHDAEVVKPEDLSKGTIWLLATLNDCFWDVHHQLKKEYLQYYFNELCYKFNRRYFEKN